MSAATGTGTGSTSTASAALVRTPVGLLLGGAVGGLAWGAGLRGAMAAFAGAGSTYSWSGTFGWILLPATATGVLLGWAEHLRRTGGRRRWRALALAPLLLTAVLTANPAGFVEFLHDGLGGGALALPLFAMLAGHALAGRGARWLRYTTRGLTAAPVAAGLLLLAITQPHLSARGVFTASAFIALEAVLAAAASIPHRAVSAPDRLSNAK